jgi:hypothetical protein
LRKTVAGALFISDMKTPLSVFLGPILSLAMPVAAFAAPPPVLTPTISVVTKSQDAVPGGSTNDHFATFGNPVFNDYNHVAFQATVQQVTPFPIVYAMAASPNRVPSPSLQVTNISLPGYTNTWSGIWAQDRSGKLQLVVRTSPPIPDIGGFWGMSDPVYNNAHAVAFTASYSPGFIYIPTPLGTNSNSVFRGGAGVWTSSGAMTNPLHPVAFVGQPAPGYPTPLVTSVGTLSDLWNQSSTNGTGLPNTNTPTTFTNPVTFTSFDQIALPDQGGVVFLATVSTTNYYYPPTSNGISANYVATSPLTQQGIWAQDTLGRLKLIAREGGTLKVGAATKTIESLSFLNATNPISGQTRHFSQNTGNLLFSAIFTDGTEAIVKVLFP